MDYGYRYKGLRNQGSTSHLNIVLQVLFMTREFREAVERSNNDDESLDFHLKNLFTDLKQQTGDTTHITEKLGITSESKQRDAAECLQNILRSLTDSVASQLFKGVIMRKNKCSECTKETETSEQFWSLPLELVDSYHDYSVADGIIKYFSESNVGGLDQLFCENCNRKSDSTDKLEIQHHPEVLTLALARYKFNYTLKKDVKITCNVRIPRFLQIPTIGDQSQRYEVYAYVELLGDRRYGRYTVKIKSQDDDKWYNFDDTIVRPSWHHFQRSEEEKNKDACLLFYRKISATEILTPNIKEASTSGDVETDKTAKTEMNVETKDQNGSEAAAQEPDNKQQDKTSLIADKKNVNSEKERGSLYKTLNVLQEHDEKSIDSVREEKRESNGVPQEQEELKMITRQRRNEPEKHLTEPDLCSGTAKNGGDGEQSVDDVTEGLNDRTCVDTQKDREKMMTPHCKDEKFTKTRRTSFSQTDQISGYKYKGLMNQGSTCYLNSVLQVLFMTREFREAVERYNNEDDSPDFHLKNLFLDLKKNTGDTTHISKKLDLTAGNKQCDAAVCLEKILSSLTHSEASQLFKGVMVVKNKCSKCRMEAAAYKSFWSIPLEVVDLYNNYSVVDGIIKYFSEPNVSGSGQLFCKNCNTKSDSTNKQEIQHHPEVLTLALTRYTFDYTLKKDVKIEYAVQIPRFLQIPTNGDQSQRYEVYAYVEQLGDRTRHGTYTVKIKSQDDDKWYHFDDTRVSLSCPQPFQLSEERKISATEILTPNIKEASTSGDVETEKTAKTEMNVETKDQDGSEAAAQEPDNKQQDKTSLITDKKNVNSEKERGSLYKTLNVLQEQDEKSIDSVRGETRESIGVPQEQEELKMITRQRRNEPEKHLTEPDLCSGTAKNGGDGEQSVDDVTEGLNDRTCVDTQKDREKMMTPHCKDEKFTKTHRTSFSQTDQISGYKYKGLMNQGSTCYLNSVLQVLFLTREFREAVERYNNEDDSPDFHLKSLFLDLKKNTDDIKHISKKLDLTAGFVQPDAAECLQNILSNLTSSETSKLFKGVRILKNKCSQCKKETKTSEPFWRLPLELVDHDKDYNVDDGVIKYFSDLSFSGDQLCESCNTTYDSTDKLELRKHPEVLTVLLKRVQFDHVKNSAKIRCRVIIPRYLQIPPSGDQSQIYEVYAYVDHIGEGRNRRYSATIKSQDDDKWYHYDDTGVTRSCPQPFQVDDKEKNRYVYLLFYRKMSATESMTEDINEASTSGSFEPETTEQSEVNVETEEQDGGKECNKDREESEKETVKDAQNKQDGRPDKHEETKTLIPHQKSMNNEKKRHNQSNTSKVLQPYADSVNKKQDDGSRVGNKKDEDKSKTETWTWVLKQMTTVCGSVCKQIPWPQSVMGPCSGYEYNGLRNQGSTCYLNSVLQVLFMTREFREAVERNSNDKESLDFHLNNLFMDLKEKTGDTTHITRKLGITSVHKQHDAAECLENILTSSKASQLFEGLLTTKNKCSKCKQESTTSDPFWSLPLELVHSNKDYSVADGIHRYFSESNLSGQDQLFCEKCNDKSDSINKLEMEHHPEVLTLLLKRFKFDYSLRNYVKIQRSVKIPKLLQIPISGDQSQTYKLYAFVEHWGELRFGHYTVSIRSQDDGRWYDFDDTRVTLSPYQHFQLDDEEKNWFAYLLFYRKISAAETLSQDINEASASGSFEPEATQQSEVNIGQDGGDEAAGNECNVDREESDRETVKIASEMQDGRRDKGLIEDRGDNEQSVDDVTEGGNGRTSVDNKTQRDDTKSHYENQLSTIDQKNKKDQCSDKSKMDLATKSYSENQQHVKSSSDNQEIKDLNEGKQNQNLDSKQHFCDKSSGNFSTSWTEENNSSVQKSREPLKIEGMGKLTLTLRSQAKTHVQNTVGLQNMGLKDSPESQVNSIARTDCCAGGQSSTMPDDGKMAEISNDVQIQVESDDSDAPDQKGVCDLLPICMSPKIYK